MAQVEIVVPCYNEARRLPVDAFALFRLDGHDLSFLFVDDGSSDGTWDVLTALCARDPARLRAMQLPQNSGKGEAVRRGLLAAMGRRRDYVGFWDADLATPLEEVPGFCDVLEASPGVDLVIGSRVRLLGRSIERRAYRHAYGRLFATAVSSLLSLHVYDTQCGAKLFRATEDLAAALAAPFLSRWIFDVELIARLIERYEPRGEDVAERIYELPLRVWADVAGSKVTVLDAAVAGVDLARIGARHSAVLELRRRASR